MAEHRDDRNNRDDSENPEHLPSATARAHGTHGRGDDREERQDDARIAPATDRADSQRDIARDNSPDAAEHVEKRLTGELSDASWGSPASGGSTVDKRSPNDKGRRG